MSATSILVVEDDATLSDALQDTLELAGYNVITAENGKAALSCLDKQEISLIVSDINMPVMDGEDLLKQVKEHSPETPIMLMTAYGTIEQAVETMKEGAIDYLVKPFEAEVLVNMVSRYVKAAPASQADLVAVDDASQELVKLADRVAETDATVMITGESGAGKEVLAQYIHQHSARADKPFVAINCAAIPENMLEATLFGYEKGAYTGAYKASPGKFEQAQGGTILLDEISEMDQGLQAKLLRVLQEKEVERLGGDKTIQLDVRVLATSNRDMKQAVAEGQFREDLYYRLNVFPLHLKSLCQRPKDIIPIAEKLLEKHARAAGRAIPVLSGDAKSRILLHAWPGNVRELDNVMQRALILQSGNEIQAEDLHFEVSKLPAGPAIASNEVTLKTASEVAESSLNDNLKQREWNLILNAMRELKGSRKKTAAQLGISERTLRYKLAQMRDAGIAIPA
ncbi:MAG: sigma-54 dependent transcriptional regulator [Thioalkalispiraceae bacterium]|jgi:two-component system response regulator FlrC